MPTDIQDRIRALNWSAIEADLDAHGGARTGPLLTPEECGALTDFYGSDGLFRSRVIMARHGYGQGEYQYFAYPLPPIIADLRTSLYRHLAPIAERWSAALGRSQRYPAEHAVYLEQCHAAGQKRPTPLLLRYGPGDYNRLHQDLYGELVFPLQLTILLSRPQEDFTGGEFVLTEQRARMQSRAEVVGLQFGEGVIFPVRERPLQGPPSQRPRGPQRAMMRHGVSRVRSGQRCTLGVIFHDAA